MKTQRNHFSDVDFDFEQDERVERMMTLDDVLRCPIYDADPGDLDPDLLTLRRLGY